MAWYYADVRGLPEEAVFDQELKAVVRAARRMIVRFVGAPDELADDLKVRVLLDERASKHLAE